ncbi:tetratricopeptide repeat protein [Paraburkholderia sp. J12]|uniref:tetratricopeptide repeat protein n=1 Tax=Paraburkholderia sp. J12 TaxID=2805432 RepID=UPI002ABE9321|nr:tetratricopeptide repeat protein [Paraburkholderia sp. J12]
MTSSNIDAEAEAHQLVLRGAALYQGGNATEARELCLRAHELAPQSCEAPLFLGFIALDSGAVAEAIDWIGRAIAANRDLAAAHNLMGQAQQAAGQYEAAIGCYTEALRLQPDHAPALNDRGNARRRLGHADLALADYDAAVRLVPGNALFQGNRGVALRELGRHAEAIAALREALAQNAGEGTTHFNLGLALADAGQHAQALASYDEALRLPGSHALVRCARADALRALGQHDAALHDYDEALALDATLAEIHNNRAILLLFTERHEEALAGFDKAIALDPHHADAWCNRGMTLEAGGNHDTALTCYDKAISISPNHVSARFNRSLCQLTLGHYGEGWREYEWRWKTPNLRTSKLVSGKPEWRGDAALAGKRIVVYAEQGLGDTLQFCRYLPMLAARGATVLAQVQAPLVPLIRAMPGVAQTIAQGDALPEFDFHCAMMSLPLAFGTTLDTVPSAHRYLAPSAETSQAWATRLAPREGLRVGLVWAGATHAGNGPRRPFDERRSLPLSQLAPLKHHNVTFYSLQKGAAATAQLRDLEARGWDGPNLVDHTALLADFDETAALVEQLDLVISVDTSVAHLAGALGKPVWLLNRFDTCWRWLLAREDSPWYPTVKIFRQPAPGDWHSVIARVRAELDRIA